MEINELIKESFETAKEKGWHDKPGTTFGDRIALMHSELSEALEEYRKGKAVDEIYFDKNSSSPDKPEGCIIELCDLLIRVFDAAGFYKMDLEKGLKIKMDYNKTRSYRHGGKVC